MKRNENGVPIPEADLPWKCGPVTGIVSALPQGATISVTEQAAFHDADDQQFAIHAANCFPQLVAALQRIAKRPDCGCVPCLGQCDSDEEKLYELEEIKDIANAALEAAKGGDDAK
jgi:hypothetical protein